MGEGRFDGIGTEELPLQSDLQEEDPPDINDAMTGNIAKTETGVKSNIEDTNWGRAVK